MHSTPDLVVLAVAAGLRALVAERRRGVPDLPRHVGSVLHERPGHRRGALGTQRDAAAALVLEVVHLLGDDVGALADPLEHADVLEHRRLDQPVAVAARELGERGEQRLPAGRLGRQDVLRALRRTEVGSLGHRATLPAVPRAAELCSGTTSEPARSIRTVAHMAKGSGTKDDPWQLTTAPGRRSTRCTGTTRRTRRCWCARSDRPSSPTWRGPIDDLHAWLKAQGDWVDLGAADENKPAKDGTVEAFGRADDNPVGGWYGQRKGYRGRFGMYLPPLLEALGKAELTHEARNNKVRAT